jgi:hypothetical protein
MPHLNRQPFNVAVKLVLTVLLTACCTAVALRHEETFWTGPPTEDESAPEVQAGGKPSGEVAAIARRIEEKDRLAAALVDGRLTLLEAAARYQELNEAPPRLHWDRFRPADPATSDEQRHCQEVIHFVRAVLAARGDTQGALADRLEAEVREHLARGDLRLHAPAVADRRGSPPEG